VPVVGLPEDPAANVEEPRVGDYLIFVVYAAAYSLSCGFPQYNPAVATAWPLVGRHDELAAMCAAIAESGGVVLTGAAGVGKSRLAREAPERSRHRVARWIAAIARGSSSHWLRHSRRLRQLTNVGGCMASAQWVS
jgi:hypothetical protein